MEQLCLGQLMKDSAFVRACKNYLIKRGREFSTMSEVAVIAKAEQWPGFELLADLANRKPLPS